ncbi:MAG: EAL domain-containing protein [Burkholderiales bacterium]
MLSLGLASLFFVLAWLWLSWAQLKQVQLQQMGSAVTLIAGQTETRFDFIGANLDKLGDDLLRVDGLKHPDAALALLHEFKTKHSDIGGASIVLPNGQLLLSTELKPGAKPPNILVKPGWAEDFHADLQARGLSVNRPQFGYLLQKWFIPLRFAVRNTHGEPVFLLQTSILLDRQQALWRNLNFAEHPAVGLLREDGYLLSRYPSKPDSKIYQNKNDHGALYLATKAHPNFGTYFGHTADGSFRYGAYVRLKSYPLYAFLSYPESTFVSIWWRNARIPLYLITGVLLAGVLLYWANARRFLRRMRLIERRLTDMDGYGGTALPSSGVGEIDTLCEALAESQRKLKQVAHNRERLLLSAANAGTYAVRLRDGVVVEANDILLRLLGAVSSDVIGHPWRSLLDESHNGNGEASLELKGSELVRRVLRFKRKEGAPLWLSLAEYPAQLDGEDVRYGLAINVSERERLLAALGVQSERLQTLWKAATTRAECEEDKARQMLSLGLETLDMDVALLNEVSGGNLITRHLAGKLDGFALGQCCDCESLCKMVFAKKRSVLLADLSQHLLFRRHPLLTEHGIHVYVGIPIWIDGAISGTLVFMKREPLPGGFSGDDTAFMELLAAWFGHTLLQQRQREILRTMAMTDSLTLLPNRRAAELRFSEEFARAKRTGEQFAVALCDLDRFKLINDHYGHDIGDEVLRQVAKVMNQELREGDWAARWGGEEFVVFLHQAEGGASVAAMDRLRIALRSTPVPTSQGDLDVTMSIGIGMLRNAEDDYSRVISEADDCLYEAKRAGRDCVVVSESGKRGTLSKAGTLQHALQKSRIIPAYQVIVDLATNQVVADEALARLVLPDGSIQSAGEFIEAAEGVNLVHEVDQMITDRALARCAASQSAAKARSEMLHFINLSPQFLARSDLVQGLMDNALHHCAQCEGHLGSVKPVVLEITERQFLNDLGGLARDLQPLLDFGFRLALDDFGSGYSSFLYLAELPVSFLKIEGWMVRNLRQNSKVFGMVESIVILAQKQGIKTIAECIEDGETAHVLREMGVDWGQGYFFGYPECDVQAR